jgi:hypothetical protein
MIVTSFIYPDSNQDMKGDEMVEKGIFHDDLTTGDTRSRAGNDALLSEEMGKPRRPCISGYYCVSPASEIKH